MSALTYRLYLENGDDIGSFETDARDWSVGDEFFDGERVRFRIVNILADIEALGGEFAGFFVVTPIEIAV